MANEQWDYAAIVADLEAKRDALNTAIASFRTAISLGALGKVGELPPASTGMVPSGFANTSFASISGGEVPAGAFLGKSIPEAAKLYLEIVRKKQTSREIAEALIKGGMESTSKNFNQMVHSVLDRARKSNTGIVKLDRSHWGLVEWYPKGLGARPAQVAAKRARKIVANKNKGPKTTSPPAQLPKGKANERALEYLRSKPHDEHSLEAVGTHLGMGVKGARLILGKLVKQGKARMSAPGMYTVDPFNQAAVN